MALLLSYLVLIDDVWSASTWEDILVAFPRTEDHKKRGRVIVTTRFSAVATARRGTGHHVYNVVPLHPYESNILFYQALSESKSNEHIHIPDIPAQIWKICGGLPLAIMAMAGFVACNTHKELDWEKISYSLFPEKKRIQELLGGSLLISTYGEAGKDTRKGLTREELGKIVSYCYNDMPAEIITCSLFLSIYPKGSRISRKRLIRRWIAEGFVSEKDGMTVEDVAETYFSHMVKRNMIRPVEHSSSGKVKQCVVHDMVLEHIVSKATEENFSVVVGGHWLMQPPSTKIRRLSLQGSDPKRAKDMEKMNLSHIRSLTMFETMNQLPSRLFRFEIVQVLDFDGCKGFKEDYMEQICSMLLVKYLSLRRTDTKELPDTIGKLENLETLDIRQTKIFALPKDACNLGRLVNILGGDKEKHRALKLPEDFLRKKKMMKAVRILSGIEIVGGSEDLSHMTDLRKLVIYNLNFTGDDARLKLSTAIGYLCCYSLRTLVIHDDSSKFLKCLDDMTSPPKSLVSLELSGKMNKLPSWITKLDALTKLTLSMTALRADYLNHLSKLGTLFSLTFSIPAGKECPETIAMMVKNKMLSDGEIIFPDGGFESLKLLRLSAPLVPVLSFSENAMPKLERLEIQFTMLEGIYGVENLSRLEEVYLRLNDKQGEAMANKTAKELKRAVNNVAARSRKARIILLIS